MAHSTTKLCRCCHQEKPFDAFSVDASKKDSLDIYCRLCKKLKREAIPRAVAQGYQNTWRRKDPEKQRKRYRAQYAANPEAGRAKAKAWRDKHRAQKATEWTERQRKALLKSHGLTLESYDALLSTQDNVCAICASPDPIHWSKKFVVDHCHMTKRVRGLLCSNCNRGLGLFQDDPERLLAAAAYLTQDWCE